MNMLYFHDTKRRNFHYLTFYRQKAYLLTLPNHILNLSLRLKRGFWLPRSQSKQVLSKIGSFVELGEASWISFISMDEPKSPQGEGFTWSCNACYRLGRISMHFEVLAMWFLLCLWTGKTKYTGC